VVEPASATAGPASAIASSAATSANRVKRSLRKISCRVRPAAGGSKSTSAAICEWNRAGSNSEIRPVAVRPSVTNCQNASRVTPPGATAPIPVTTTRRRPVMDPPSSVP